MAEPHPDALPGREARRRVAVTLEQCWHRVPGGTASSALEATRALAERRRARPGRGQRPPSPPAAGRRGCRRSPCARCPCPAWRSTRAGTACGAPPWSGPPARSTSSTSPAWPCPRRRRRWWSPCTTWPSWTTRRRGTRHGVKFFHRAIELARRDARLVCCPSQDTLDDCVAHGFDPSRLRLVPWGVDAERDRPRRRSSAVRARYRLDRPYVLWTGTIEPRKNLPDPARGVPARSTATASTSCWSGPRAGTRTSTATSGPPSGGCGCSGFVPGDELRALYAGAAVFCLPSLREGFGLPVLEAMAQGTPVVTSARGATAEVAGDAAAAGRPARRRRRWPRPWPRCSTTRSWPRRLAAASRRRAGGDAVVAHGRAAGRRVRRGGAVTPVRVGANLLWLVPGVVGGSEEYTVRLLESFARIGAGRPRSSPCSSTGPSPTPIPALCERYPTVVAPVDGAVAPGPGGGRVDLAGPPGPRRAPRLRPPPRRHHAAAPLGRPAWSPSTTCSPSPTPSTSAGSSGPTCGSPCPARCAGPCRGRRPQRVHPPRRRRAHGHRPRPHRAGAARASTGAAPATRPRWRGCAGSLRPGRAAVLPVPGHHLPPQEPRHPGAGLRPAGRRRSRADAGAHRGRGRGRAEVARPRSSASASGTGWCGPGASRGAISTRCSTRPRH